MGREALADAVTWVARALPSRPVIPILAGLLLEADEGGLTLSCFDYEVSARVNADAAVAEPGRALVSGRLLAEIARSLPDRPVDIATEGDNVTLSCGTARFTLQALPVEDFPALPQLPPTVGTVDSAEFATAVTQVAVAAGRDDTLPMLTGILVEIDGSAMTLVATDRYRMSTRELDWRPARPDVRASALVPARTLADAAKSMASEADVVISLAIADRTGSGQVSGADADGLIGFDGGRRRLTMRLLGTEFITYKSRFPREFGYRAALAAGPFSEAIRRVALVADRDSRLLLTFGSDEVVIETGSSDGSQAVEIIGAELEGEDGFAIAFNPHYLLDGIIAAAAVTQTRDAPSGPRAGQAGPGESVSAGEGSGEYAGRTGSDGSTGLAGPGEPGPAGRGGPGEPYTDVFLQLTSPDKPAVIMGGQGYRYLLAPMRI